MISDGYVKVVGVPAAWGQFLYFFIKHHDPLSEPTYAPEGIHFPQYIFVPLKNPCHGVVIHLRIIGSLENAGYPIGVIVWVVVKTNYQTIFRLILLGRRRFSSFTNLPFRLLLPSWEVRPFYKIFNLFFSNLFLIKCRPDKIGFCENPRFFASLDTVYTNVLRTIISYRIKLLKMRKWIKKCHN